MRSAKGRRGMLKIYGADLSSPSNKVRFTANALRAEYEYIKVSLMKGENRAEWFLKLHPAGKIPVIVDDDFILFESNAIIKYLAGKGKSTLYPEEIKKRALIDQWMDFIALHVNSAVSSVVYNRVFAPWIKTAVDENAVKTGVGFLGKFLPVVENQLAKNVHVTGECFTLADIALLAALDPVEVAEIDIKIYSNMTKWRDKLKQKDFYTRCHKDYADALNKMRTLA
ncbi:MAG TPA: hypothetical protein DD723_10345 [Candidatus Omnitrophica bacterium]|nr:hypothetical protein [Candidatus Omnitrophota bacterium]